MKRKQQRNDYGSLPWAVRVSSGFRDFGFETTPEEILEIVSQIADGTYNQADPVAIMIADVQKKVRPA